MTPVIAELPSKGKPKMVWGVDRVVAVVAAVAKVALAAVAAVLAVKAVVAKVAEIAVEAELAVTAVKAVVADAAVTAVNAAVAVLAFPVNSPTKFVAPIISKPDMLVYVPPKMASVDPKVISLWANWPFVILAVAERLAVVKPVAWMVFPVREIPEPAVKVG